MRLRLDHFLRLAAMPAILALVFMLLVTLSGHPAWSQAARTIKIVVAIRRAVPETSWPAFLPIRSVGRKDCRW